MIVGMLEAALIGLVAGAIVLISAVGAGWLALWQGIALIVALAALCAILRGVQTRTGVTTLATVEELEEGA